MRIGNYVIGYIWEMDLLKAKRLLLASIHYLKSSNAHINTMISLNNKCTLLLNDIDAGIC